METGLGSYEGRSFRDTLVGKDICDPMEEVVLDDGFDGNAIWKGLGLLGSTRDLNTLTSLKEWLFSVRLGNVHIRYVGGLSVVLVFEDNVSMLEFLNTKEVWNPVFSSLVIWDGQRSNLERLAWIKIFGLPLFLFDKYVVDRIRSKFGRVVQSVQADENLEDFSYAMIGVLCQSTKRINQSYKLKWRNEEFVVLVEEDTGEWIPDCIGVEVEESIADFNHEKRPWVGMDTQVDATIHCENTNSSIQGDQEPAMCAPSKLSVGRDEGTTPQIVTNQVGGNLEDVEGLRFIMSVASDISGSKKKKERLLS
ncbi:hypothetical protein HanLR1_Chr06g0214251 [Helianthus annuus]|nr:hypothetical protein HanLR1_Chr06g0214251 [Helianthus annuus]